MGKVIDADALKAKEQKSMELLYGQVLKELAAHIDYDDASAIYTHELQLYANVKVMYHYLCSVLDNAPAVDAVPDPQAMGETMGLYERLAISASRADQGLLLTDTACLHDAINELVSAKNQIHRLLSNGMRCSSVKQLEEMIRSLVKQREALRHAVKHLSTLHSDCEFCAERYTECETAQSCKECQRGCRCKGCVNQSHFLCRDLGAENGGTDDAQD